MVKSLGAELWTSEFEDSVVMVTGAASGIGRAVALAFARCGAKIIATDVAEPALAETVALVEAAGSEGLGLPTDVSKADDVARAVDTGVKKFGKLDAAVNSAGVPHPPRPAHEVSEEDWNRVIAVNLNGVFLSMKYQIPAILEGGAGGSITNISSRSGLIASKLRAAYSASKHGVLGLTKSAAMDYAAQGLRINSVCPGPIRTEMFERDIVENPGAEQFALSTIPARRLGIPDEVAYSALWLASSQAAFVTGIALPVDGGSVLGHWPH